MSNERIVEIFDSVQYAMQAAEEMEGVEGLDYVELMTRIIQLASGRMYSYLQVMQQDAEPPKG
jgi:hypothetical protein